MNIHYTIDPQWDGDRCINRNTNCCTSSGMPWFHRKFPTAQLEDVEVRIRNFLMKVFRLVDQVQLYVQ